MSRAGAVTATIASRVPTRATSRIPSSTRVLVVAALVVLGGVGCGSRVADDGVAAVAPAPVAPAPVAPTTAPLPTPPRRDVTEPVPVEAPSTSATTTAPSSAPAAPAPPRPVNSYTPPTLDPDVLASTTTRPAVTTVPTTSATDKAAFCAATKVYSIDDLVGLGTRVVGDPTGLLAAYDTMVASAPTDLADAVVALGPITHQTVDLVRAGQITTPQQLQVWLADTAPRDDLEHWVRAQQVIVPAAKAICA